MKRLSRLALLFAVLTVTVAGCSDFMSGYDVANREPFTPLPIYTTWWATTEACSGESGRLESIEWFVATSIRIDGAIAQGVWKPPHVITLVVGFEESERTVRHEMLHDLLQGDPDHSSRLWQDCDLNPR